ncbi:MAG TPA: hypothetical protein VM101_11315 [Flavitalea sp.]|nr:hypothetical protein [Flavitalea sp.]
MKEVNHFTKSNSEEVMRELKETLRQCNLSRDHLAKVIQETKEFISQAWERLIKS